MASGIALLGCVYLGYHRAVGVMLMSGAVVGLVDGLSVLRSTKPVDESKTGEERDVEMERAKMANAAMMGHWGIPAIAAAIGVWIFRTSEY